MQQSCMPQAAGSPTRQSRQLLNPAAMCQFVFYNACICTFFINLHICALRTPDRFIRALSKGWCYLLSLFDLNSFYPVPPYQVDLPDVKIQRFSCHIHEFSHDQLLQQRRTHTQHVSQWGLQIWTWEKESTGIGSVLSVSNRLRYQYWYWVSKGLRK